MVQYEAVRSWWECIFCRIAQGVEPPLADGLFYETDQYMAWLDPFPNTLGASVVAPKQHFGSDNLHLPDEVLSKFVLEAKKVAQILEDYFEDVGRVGLVMEWTGIDHAHIKLYPMHGTGYMKSGEWKQILSDRDQYFETYPGYLSSGNSSHISFGDIADLAKNIQQDILSL